jgi:hypothetical protein
MPFSVLSHLVEIERQRPRVDRRTGRSSMAGLGEVQLRAEDPSPLVTNMRGTFLMTHKSPDHVARYGFSLCPPEEEGVLLMELARVLSVLSDQNGWGLRCTSVPEAVESFRQVGLEARTVVVSSQLAREVLGRETPVPEGLAGMVGRMQVLVTGLPENTAIVALAPVRVGYCVRTGDFIGMAIRPQAFRVVQT